MAGQAAAVVIKKRQGGHAHGHHGGAWKVAYADFVTAMMAFFLLLWLLNATSEEQRAGLADYFDPTIPITLTMGGGAGIMGGPDVFSPEDRAGQSEGGVPPRATLPLSQSGAADGPRTALRWDGAPADAVPPGVAEEPAAGPANDTPQNADQTGDGLVESAAADLGTLTQDGHVVVRALPGGLLIELVDLVDEPLFAGGGAAPMPILRDLVDVIVPAIADMPNHVQIIGHTDATPFRGTSSYSNWELSADRANAARRLLVAAGLPPERISAVIGRAATDLATSDPADPRNRRIAIKLIAIDRDDQTRRNDAAAGRAPADASRSIQP